MLLLEYLFFFIFLQRLRISDRCFPLLNGIHTADAVNVVLVFRFLRTTNLSSNSVILIYPILSPSLATCGSSWQTHWNQIRGTPQLDTKGSMWLLLLTLEAFQRGILHILVHQSSATGRVMWIGITLLAHWSFWMTERSTGQNVTPNQIVQASLKLSSMLRSL